MRNLQWLPLLPVAALSTAIAPAHAVLYATAEEAAKRAFPEATGFKERELQLTVEEMKALPSDAGIAARAVRFRALVALQGDKSIGTVVIDAVIGKFDLIDYAVGLDSSGKLRSVEILAYRESHGYEVRLPAWRKQFVGKDKRDKLRVSEDINNISGATLSATHVTDGVRRIVFAVDALNTAGRLN
jgi:Na+-translocating ferredoxin:NAD+ oxidoreductase RnfG subunit